MIIRSIIYIGILSFFLWDYKQDPKKFKSYVFPIIAVTFIAGTSLFTKLDYRIQLTFQIITGLLTILYLWGYYKDFKMERFKEKKAQREMRQLQRQTRDEDLLRDILEAKNKSRRNKSSSYEISIDISSKAYNLSGQMNLFNDNQEELLEFEEAFEDQIEKETNNQVLENQLGIFDNEKQ